ncbi:MAG: hypothetical protein ACI9YH_000406 [Colwellia sp.]|jgi:hypothetical protein
MFNKINSPFSIGAIYFVQTKLALYSTNMIDRFGGRLCENYFELA